MIIVYIRIHFINSEFQITIKEHLRKMTTTNTSFDWTNLAPEITKETTKETPTFSEESEEEDSCHKDVEPLPERFKFMCGYLSSLTRTARGPLAWGAKFKYMTALCSEKMRQSVPKIVKHLADGKLPGMCVGIPGNNGQWIGPTGQVDWNYEKTTLKFKVQSGTALYDFYNIDSVSFAIPIDASGNRLSDGCDENNLPTTLEILLFGRDGKPNYNHPDCPDVDRFDNVSEMVTALNNLTVFDDGKFTIIVEFTNDGGDDVTEKLQIGRDATIGELREAVLAIDFYNWIQGKDIYLKSDAMVLPENSEATLDTRGIHHESVISIIRCLD